jgi:hypothetical protein
MILSRMRGQECSARNISAILHANKKPCSCEQGFLFCLPGFRLISYFLVHAFHTAAAVSAAGRSTLLIFRDFRDQSFGGEHQ